VIATDADGKPLGVGDRVQARRNDWSQRIDPPPGTPVGRVTNRETYTVLGPDPAAPGGVLVARRDGAGRAVQAAPSLIHHVLHSSRVYIVPRTDGRVIIGATVEYVGFRKAVTAAGICDLLEGAIELVPGLADCDVIETWAGFRPDTEVAANPINPVRSTFGKKSAFVAPICAVAASRRKR